MTGCSTLALVCALNDAKTGLADMKGNIVNKRIRALFTVNCINHPKLMKRLKGCRAEHSISSQRIRGSVACYGHFHVNGHSGYFINILRTFNWVELFFCFSSRNRAARQKNSITAGPLVN